MKTRTFRLFWLTGEIENISGPDLGDQYLTLSNAMSNSGIGGGALRALDYWREITEMILKELEQ